MTRRRLHKHRSVYTATAGRCSPKLPITKVQQKKRNQRKGLTDIFVIFYEKLTEKTWNRA